MANLMVNPTVYASILFLNKIMQEKKLQENDTPHGCLEVTRIGADNKLPGLSEEQITIQLTMNEQLRSTSEDEIEKVLMKIAQEPILTAWDLLEMSNREMEIQAEFLNIQWDKMIDSVFIDKNLDAITILNP